MTLNPDFKGMPLYLTFNISNIANTVHCAITKE